MDKPTVFSQIDGAAINATSYYRILLPIMRMAQQEDGPIPAIDTTSALIPEEERRLGIAYSDFNLFYQNINPAALSYSRYLAGFRPRPRVDGTLWYPPCIICDTDDDVFNVQPLNPAFARWGIRNPLNGEPLGDGCEIEVEHPEYVTEATDPRDYYCETRKRWIMKLWKDDPKGEDPSQFCVRRNLIATEVWRNYLKLANLVTCSTPRSEAYILRECPTAKTFVSYNMVDVEHYPQDIQLAEHPDEVRILWQGSPTHHECLWPIAPVIARVMKKYPHAKFYMWGAPYKWLLNNLGAQGVHIPYVPYPEYKVRLCTIGHDINLCPLGTNVFNDSRSAIKWYESSVIPRPAATLAQKWGAYQDEIQDGETGLLWETPEEFETKLCGLIEDATLRKQLSGNAKQWIIENRSDKVLAPKLWAKYKEVLELHRASCGPPIEVPADEPVPAEQPTS